MSHFYFNLLESVVTEGLQRRLRVQKSLEKQLHGNKQTHGNPGANDPNRQVIGANTEDGRNIFTPSERQSINARAANTFNRFAGQEEKRAERIRGRIVRGGKDKAGRAALNRMSAGILRANPVGQGDREIKRTAGGEYERRLPTHELQGSRNQAAKFRQAADNATGEAQKVRQQQRDQAEDNRDLRAREAKRKAGVVESVVEKFLRLAKISEMQMPKKNRPVDPKKAAMDEKRKKFVSGGGINPKHAPKGSNLPSRKS